MKQIQITEADDGIRLDRWFKRHYPGIPHALLEKSLRQGQVKVNDKKSKSSDRIQQWHVITFPAEWDGQPAPARAKKRWEPTEEEALALQRLVLYRDELLMVINKPAGLAVQGGTGLSKNLDDMLDALRFGSLERPKLVHRLDKDTSGALVLARTTRAASMLTRKFAAKETEKIYVALVFGLPLPMQGVIDAPLSKLAHGKDSRTEALGTPEPRKRHEHYESVDIDEDDGKPSVTEYEVLEHLSNKLSWVKLKPITGRTHQLRVHMASIGHPIIGDGKYGGPNAFVRGSMEVAQQLHLHAQQIIITGVGGKTINVKAPLPPHMKHSREVLGMD